MLNKTGDLIKISFVIQTRLLEPLLNIIFLDKPFNIDDKEVNMEKASEKSNNGGKSGNKNPLAFLGLKRVDDVEDDEEEDDKNSDDINVDFEGRIEK